MQSIIYQKNGKKSGSNLFYKSPFRNFHDYGSGWHGDIINFVQELYHISPIDAAKTLIQDFSLPIQMKQKTNYKQIKSQKHKNLLNKKVREALENWFNTTFIKLCDADKTNRICIETLNKRIKRIDDFENEDIGNALQYLYYQQSEINLWIDEFINTTTEDEKVELFKHRKEIEKICQ